ncbi:MAG: MBL fold metallo-hydrolase [Planctomycetes bacterium]|nr:MBL fold metallo-hydrolase [Planctomycetota bacterium]
MKIRFWGTRGSVPVSGPAYVEFGGNTPCLQVTLDSCSEVLVLDSGTGIRELGNHLLAKRDSLGSHVRLFLTHAHWDHIQGFPFFAPAYIPGYKLDIHCTKEAEDFLGRQMSPPFFPVGLEVMQADIHFHRLSDRGEFQMGEASVRWIPLPHPQLSTGIRVEEAGRAFVFATDTEHPAEGLNLELVEFAQDAAVLAYDAQYTPSEYQSGKQGWGHSTFREGVDLAKAASVERLVLFSHDPSHDDASCRAIEEAARALWPETWGARQGVTIDI